MRHTRRELAQRAQLICPRRPLAFFLLLGDVARDTQHAGCSPIDHKRGVVYTRISQLSIVSEVAHLVGLRRAGQSGCELLPYQLAIAFVDHAEKWPTNEVTALIT